MKDYHVVLGGKERRLRYRSRDRIEVEAALNRPGSSPSDRDWRSMHQILRHDVMGLDENNEPTGRTSLRAQAYFLWVGIRHEAPGVTLEQVLDWIDEHLPQPIGALIDPVWKAAFYSGVVLGFSLDIEAEMAKQKDATAPVEERETGKAELVATPS